jgi:cbb3-type cytochrome oxidase cytochrome c subunit
MDAQVDARIDDLFFGTDEFTFAVTSNVAQVVQKTRTYARFSDAAEEVVDARVYLGIHFRFADVVARRQGKQSADWAFSHILRPVR